MPTTTFRRRKPKGGFTTVTRRSRGAQRRKQRQSAMKGKRRQLKAGQKLNARGQIVSDTNQQRVFTRASKQKRSKKTSVVGRGRKKQGPRVKRRRAR